MQCCNLSEKRVDRPNESATLGTRKGLESPPLGGILARLPTSKSRRVQPTERDMDKLPDPWILNTEKLLERLEKCRKAVMDIPICSLERTHLGIRYALTEIVNLQEHLQYCLQYHREAQARFAKLAETKPDKETTATPQAKVAGIRA